MKKFLSIFVAVAMVLSLFAGTVAPRASAAVGLSLSAIADSTKYKFLDYANLFAAGPPIVVTYSDTDPAKQYIFNMGDVISGTVEFAASVAAGVPITITLYGRNSTGPAYDVVVDQTTQYGVGGTQVVYNWQIGTGNVAYDGPYTVTVAGPVSAFSQLVYIKYNLSWKTKLIKTCAGFNTVEGWILRGNYMAPTYSVIVGMTYPDGKLAASYFVTGGGSGQFSLTFPVDPASQIGEYNLFVRDTYPEQTYATPLAIPLTSTNYTTYLVSNAATDPDNDAMVYDTLDNMPTNLGITASTYYSPVLLYKSVAEQPLLLQVVDQNGDYVQDATWTISADALIHEVVEISPGFYRFLLDIASPVTGDVRLTAHKNLYGSDEESTVVINLRNLGAFNPYVDVNGSNSGLQNTVVGQVDCKTGRYVYDKLPCTIGNTLDITVDYWEPLDAENWYVYDFTPTINGPVRQLTTTFATSGTGTFIIEEAGKISVSISVTMWERVLQPDADGIEHAPCIDWFSGGGWLLGHFDGTDPRVYHGGTFAYGTNGENEDGWTPEPENACCHTYEKTFDICEVKSCALVGVTLENGAQTSATAIEVGKKADLVVNVSGANAPAGLSCGCNTKIVRIFMRKCTTTGESTAVASAFTFDTYGGSTSTVSELWYNGSVAIPRPYPVGLTDPTTTTPDYPWAPQYYDSTGLEYGAPGSVTFAATTPGAIVIDNCEKLTFKGITFNYTNQGSPCRYYLVVETFGLNRSFDACGNMLVTYPFISETLQDINITPVVATLSTTPTVYELGIDPIDLLAGVPATIEITDPNFTYGTPATLWSEPLWSYTFNGVPSYLLTDFPTMNWSSIDTGYKFTFSCGFPEAGTLVITGTSWDVKPDAAGHVHCAKKEVVTFTLKVVLPAFDVKIELADGTIIPNDHIITEGLIELIHVVPTDPRADGHHDFTTDTTWNLEAFALVNDCGLPTSAVCSSTPVGCTTPSPVAVYGLDNPNLEDAAQFELYLTFGTCPMVLVDTFTLVEPTVTLTPGEIPFTIPASATHVVFTVKDAHGHGAPGVDVTIEGSVIGTAGASGYNFVAGHAMTSISGEADWAFVPPYSGEYYVGIGMDNHLACFEVPCGWSAFGATKILTAKYQAPVVDTTAPVVSIATGIDGSKVSASTLNLSGKVTDNVGVTQLYVGFNKVDVLPDGSFMAALKLVAGENTITVVAYDAAGNKGTATAKVTYTAPVDTSIVLVLTIGADIVSVNGKATSIDAAPEIVASRTYVPMRFIAESFGATVEWLPETQGITITLGEHTVGLQIGNATAVVDGTIISLPAAPYIKNGRTMVPLRLISEAFGGNVVWDAATRTITITYQP